jgi:hypothetical protein
MLTRPDTTRRNVLGAMVAVSAATAAPVAAALPQTHSEFDAALRKYRRAREAGEHDHKHGTLRAAYDLYDRRTKGFFARYGNNVARADEDVRERWSAYLNEMTAAEDVHTKAFSEPRWAAFKDLKAAPAPTIEALLRKIDIMIQEGDGGDEVIDLVKADLRRLAELEAQS